MTIPQRIMHEGPLQVGPATTASILVKLTPEPLRIVILGADGTALLTLTETGDGKLHAEGPREHWTEAAQVFIEQLAAVCGRTVLNRPRQG